MMRANGLSLIFLFALTCIVHADSEFVGQWDCQLESPGGALKFGLTFDASKTDGQPPAVYLTNGGEKIQVPSVSVDGQVIKLAISHYDSELTFKHSDGKLDGVWEKRRGADEWIKLKFSGKRKSASSKSSTTDQTGPIAGRWRVKFSDSEDPAVGIFKSAGGDKVAGTFLTTTGDYRFLYGTFVDQTLAMSCFDGAHAFLFRAKLGDDKSLSGDFWSSNTWHETWDAVRDEDAKLPDAFKQTSLVSKHAIGSFSFPDLSGKMTALDDPKFSAPARIIYVFGSWCPNCHDAAGYFKELRSRYPENELSILGLAFELTGDFDRDAAQVKKYIARHEVRYPILIAGISDKEQASKTLPFLDRVRSYPTTVFLNDKNEVQAIHTGFSGPATGEAYEKLKKEFESTIDRLVGKQ